MWPRIGRASRRRKFRVPPIFFLRPHVFLCRAVRHWVILDVSRDKYLCVDRRQFESLGPWILGWEGTEQGASVATAPPREALALAERLLSVQILSEDGVGAKPAQATRYSPPTDAVDSGALATTCRFWWAYAGSFFLSCAKASWQLRSERFESIVVATRARRPGNRNSPAAAFDIGRARPLLSAFERLRWFYPRPYLCMFDSLALIHFLAHFRLHPDWVFGVKADPFEAHCWVQADGIVLNDTLGRVSGFTPIMYV